MITFDVKYYKGDGTFSHKYEECWEESDLYCPKCGLKSVYVECGAGDYYDGNKHICINCESTFYLPDSPQPSTDDSDLQRVAALRIR